ASAAEHLVAFTKLGVTTRNAAMKAIGASRRSNRIEFCSFRRLRLDKAYIGFAHSLSAEINVPKRIGPLSGSRRASNPRCVHSSGNAGGHRHGLLAYKMPSIPCCRSTRI